MPKPRLAEEFSRLVLRYTCDDLTPRAYQDATHELLNWIVRHREHMTAVLLENQEKKGAK